MSEPPHDETAGFNSVAAEVQPVDGGLRSTVPRDLNTTVDGDCNTSVGGDRNTTVHGDQNTTVGGIVHTHAGEMVLEARHRIVFRVGEHEVRLDESGLTIHLSRGALTVTGVQQVEVKGDTLRAEGATISVTAAGATTLTGNPLRLN